MNESTQYLPVDTADMAEISNILLNAVLTAEQQIRVSQKRDISEESNVLVAFKYIDLPISNGISDNELAICEIEIEDLIFGPAVSIHKTNLANLLLGLGQNSHNTSLDIH
jgi:hypothetical protein